MMYNDIQKAIRMKLSAEEIDKMTGEGTETTVYADRMVIGERIKGFSIKGMIGLLFTPLRIYFLIIAFAILSSFYILFSSFYGYISQKNRYLYVVENNIDPTEFLKSIGYDDHGVYLYNKILEEDGKEEAISHVLFSIRVDNFMGASPIGTIIFCLGLFAFAFWLLFYFVRMFSNILTFNRDLGTVTLQRLSVRKFFRYKTYTANFHDYNSFRFRVISTTFKHGHSLSLAMVFAQDNYQYDALQDIDKYVTFYTHYMDRNRPLPEGKIFDPYREADFERRKAEGFPKPLYPSSVRMVDFDGKRTNL